MNETIVREVALSNNLWVEGPDDKQLLYHLLRYYHIENQVKIEDKNGVENLFKVLKLALKVGEPQRLGVIIDVDEDLHRRWRSFSATLNEAGYVNISSVPASDGTIITQEDLPDIGIWLMPDNQAIGMVEHFVSALIPPGDVLWPMASDIVQKVIAAKCNFALVHQIKAEIHTWLAWQEEPGRPMGQAITKRYFDANAPHALKLIGWVRQLFHLI